MAQIKWLLAQNAIGKNYKHKIFNKKPNGRNHHMDDKKEGQKNKANRNQRRERASPFYGRELSHPQPF
jgi:hypothetical protein